MPKVLPTYVGHSGDTKEVFEPPHLNGWINTAHIVTFSECEGGTAAQVQGYMGARKDIFLLMSPEELKQIIESQ